MTRIGITDLYNGSWTTPLSGSSKTITVTAYYDNDEVSDSVNIQVVSTFQWELSLEIDYIIGFYPNKTALDYMVTYYKTRAIDISYEIFDNLTRNDHIDVLKYETGNYTGPHQTDPSWYCNTSKYLIWANRSSKVGPRGEEPLGIAECETHRGYDNTLGGNYMGVFAGHIQDVFDEDLQLGAMIVVLLHEMGHSIGILEPNNWYQDDGEWKFKEEYDPDLYSVMGHATHENMGFSNHWFYSKEYWSLRDMSY